MCYAAKKKRNFSNVPAKKVQSTKARERESKRKSHADKKPPANSAALRAGEKRVYQSMACEECSTAQFQFNNGIEFIKRISWAEIKFTSTWNTKKRNFCNFFGNSVCEKLLVGRQRKKGNCGKREIKISTSHSAKERSKRSAQTRNVTQFKNQFHSTTGFSLSPLSFFAKAQIPASIVFHFILFMKTSGSADGERGRKRGNTK